MTGCFSDQWTEAPMQAGASEMACSSFTATAWFDESQVGRMFRWGVVVDVAGKANTWGIATEVGDMHATDCSRAFILRAAGQAESYWLTTTRRFGAQKLHAPGMDSPAIRSAVWAPNAQNVELVFAQFDAEQFSGGYIDDDGNGIDASVGQNGAFPLFAQGDGIFATDLARSPSLTDYEAFSQRLYMFRITNEQGERYYKTDLWSRNQVGRGVINPHGQKYTGTFEDLDETVSCSIVTDPDLVATSVYDAGWPRRDLISAGEFWRDEFTPGLHLPQRAEDFIVYELHVSSFATVANDASPLANALALLDRLVDLGVNVIELFSVPSFTNLSRHWWLGSSHFFCVQTSVGGGDELKLFVRACHRKGVAVILDVFYSGLSQDGGRSQWGYDSDPSESPEHNIYYWYEGQSHDYASVEGGYVDNGSSGWTPRLWHENVRQLFTSSAAMMIDEYHINGIKVDFTDALHKGNRLHADGRPLEHVNLFGIKLLRELARTVRFVDPAVFLIAEDNTGWEGLTRPVDQGGVGFDAVWSAGLYSKRPRIIESFAASSGSSQESQRPPAAEPSVSTAFEVPGNVFRQLHAYSAANGLTFNEIVTKALQAFLGKD
ncbi:MAG: hypothetical protein ACLPYS_14840 [Vulcanimicrobiaceae bacterium]